MLKLLLPIILFCACKSRPGQPTFSSVSDSLEFSRKVDSMTKTTIRKALFDTTNVYLAPVKVSSAKVVQREHSSYRNVRLAWTNKSSKNIVGIKFNWYGVTAFNEPADMGGYLEGIGGGMTDRLLRPGRSDNGEWSVLSKNAENVLCAWPIEVAYEDGTFWKLSK